MLSESTLESLGYDDILLLPQYSEINSRDDVNLYLENKNYIPIFSAPMKNISEVGLVSKLGQLGGVGLLHRFFENPQDRFDAVEQLGYLSIPFGISISIHDWENELKFVKFACEHGSYFTVIDTASGYLKKTLDAVKSLFDFRNDNSLDFYIIGGNVVDYSGCYDLAKAGSDILRINIGTGLQCLTSKSIGVGCPPLTAIRDCAEIRKKYPQIQLLADGGIYNPGQALKALAFGMTGIMAGSLFGRATECGNNGIIFGMSSFSLQERMNKTKKSNEGTVTIIPKEEIRPLKEIWNEFCYGLKSGLSYLGISDINKIQDADIEYINVKGE